MEAEGESQSCVRSRVYSLAGWAWRLCSAWSRLGQPWWGRRLQMGSLMCLMSLPGGQDGGADQASLSPLIGIFH